MQAAVPRELCGDQRETCPSLGELKSSSQQAASMAVVSSNTKATDPCSTFPATNDLFSAGWGEVEGQQEVHVEHPVASAG